MDLYRGECARMLLESASLETIQRRRCFIPADGFVSGRGQEGSLSLNFFHIRDESPFGLAGIWDEWQGAGKLIAEEKQWRPFQGE